jgi:hypothetical protein
VQYGILTPVARAVSSFGPRRIPPFSSYGGILSAVDSTALFLCALHRTNPVHDQRAAPAPRSARRAGAKFGDAFDAAEPGIVKSQTLLASNRLAFFARREPGIPP